MSLIVANSHFKLPSYLLLFFFTTCAISFRYNSNNNNNSNKNLNIHMYYMCLCLYKCCCSCLFFERTSKRNTKAGKGRKITCEVCKYFEFVFCFSSCCFYSHSVRKYASFCRYNLIKSKQWV